MDGLQHPTSGDPIGNAAPTPPPKKQKTGHGADFSGNVRDKIQGSRRTGQACDRCKTRKIRCDSTTGGCTPCRQNNVKCTTVDRNTGRATTRGYTEHLEDENRWLTGKILEYEQAMKQAGIAFKPALPDHVSQSDTISERGDARSEASVAQFLPYRIAHIAPGDSYATSNSYNGQPLIDFGKGTSLSCLGVEVNIEDFVSKRSNEADYTDWVQFWTAVFNRTEAVTEPRWPETQKDFETYAQWYFGSLNAYTPALHKPEVYEWISNLYNDPTWTPTTIQRVQLHAMLAHLKYQISQRSEGVPDGAQRTESFAHLRYALSHAYDMLVSRTIQDLQALALIALNLRNFDRPGVAWAWSSVVITVAVQLGYHRSAKVYFDEVTMPSPHEVELRKRVFWMLYGVHTGLAGKLGRPALVRPEDIDVEFAEPLPDYLSGERPLSEFYTCSFVIGIHTQRLMFLFGKMYATVYALHRPPSQVYEPTIRRLEEEVKIWRSEIPAEIASSTKARKQEQVFALYLDYWESEFNLLLHHPALCPFTDPKQLKSNEDACVSASTRMLDVVLRLRKERSLDMPWVNTIVYVAAMFTRLFVEQKRTESISLVEFEQLKNDMQNWLQILTDCGETLGSGKNLANTIETIVEASLSRITQQRLPQGIVAILNSSAPSAHAHQDHAQVQDTRQQATYTVPSYTGVASTPDPSYHVSQQAPAPHANHAYNAVAAVAAAAQGYHYPPTLAAHNTSYPPSSTGYESYPNANVQYAHNYDAALLPTQSAASAEWQTWTQTTQHLVPASMPPGVGALVALGSTKVEPGLGAGQGGVTGVNWPMNLFHDGDQGV